MTPRSPQRSGRGAAGALWLWAPPRGRCLSRRTSAIPPERDSSEPTDPVERKRRSCQWLHRELKEQQRRVVAGRSVQMDLVTCAAAMNEDPLTIASDGDGDRLHRRAAVCAAVARCVVIEVTAPEAAWTVVPVSCARRDERHVKAAASAAKRARGGSGARETLVGQAGSTSKGGRCERNVARPLQLVSRAGASLWEEATSPPRSQSSTPLSSSLRSNPTP